MKRIIIIIAVAMTSLAGTAQAQGILRNGATAAKALTGYAMVRTANAMTTRPHAAGAGTQYRTGAYTSEARRQQQILALRKHNLKAVGQQTHATSRLKGVAGSRQLLDAKAKARLNSLKRGKANKRP